MKQAQEMKQVIPQTIGVSKPGPVPLPTERISGLTSATTTTEKKTSTRKSTSTTTEKSAKHNIKRRRTAKAVQSVMIRKYHEKEAVHLAYAAAMTKIMYEREHLPINYRQTVVSVVEEVNRFYATSLNAETVRRRLRNGLQNVPPRIGGGRKPVLPLAIEGATINAITLYINLACSEMKKTPD